MRLPLMGAQPPPEEPLAPSDRLDCIVVGPYIAELQALIERARSTRGVSAHYDDVAFSSVLVDGRRLSYTDLFNRAVSSATGQPHQLSPFNQPSAAVCTLTSFLRRRGLNVELINFFNHEQDRFRALLAQSPTAVALTTTFYVEPEPLAEVVRFVRAHAPNTKIIIGGPYVYRIGSHYDDVTQDYVLQELGADFYVFDSQGESALASLLRALRRGDDDATLARVPNLIYTRDNLAFHRTGRVVERNDLDANAVDWSSFDPSFITPTVYMRTALSCPFACSFCNYPIVAGDHVLNELDVIMAQLRWLRDRGVKNVAFVDDTFNVPLPRFKALLRRMIDERLDLTWMSFFRCSNADAEAFELMKKSGCKLVFLGIESADEEILKRMDKFARVDRYREGIRQLNDHGIVSYVSMIVGFPGETQRSVDTTMEFIESTRPTLWGSQIFYYDPHTPLAERAAEYGLRGTGFSWSHATADWSDAVRWMRQMLEGVRGSEWVGGYALGSWGMFYLLTLGYPVQELTTFLRHTRGMVLEGLDDREATGLDRLAAIFRADRARAPL
jgi:radical SAM PhpK family P-methyltransferase